MMEVITGLKMIDKISIELVKAKQKHPQFADSLFEAVCILSEEVGEVAQAVYDFERDSGGYEDIEQELAQVGAVVARFLRFVEIIKKEM